MRKSYWFLSLFLSLTLFTVSEGWTQPLFPYAGGKVKPGTHAPKITHTFAVEKGHYGYILKIYIEADDPDGDMNFIATGIYQAGGYGRYSTDWTYVKPQYQKHFKGYLQLNTFEFRIPREWAYVTLNVSVIDKARNESNVAVFPFTFVSGIRNPYKYTLPAPFTKEDPKLGNIFLSRSPGRSGN